MFYSLDYYSCACLSPSGLSAGASAYISLIGLSGKEASGSSIATLFAFSSALAASSSVAKTTNPHPLLLFVSLSPTTFVYVTLPY